MGTLKAVILAGGFGTRMGDETSNIPKPMIEIGGQPILWHIMKSYSRWGINDFIICLGYRGYVIKEYFSSFSLHTRDVIFDLANRSVEVLGGPLEPWRITLVDTGNSSMTGGRLKRIRSYVDDGTFCMTYGDGLSDVDMDALIGFHRGHGKLATVTSVTPPGRFGILDLDGEVVRDIREKPATSETAINGGFFVLEPGALDAIDGDDTSWELEPLQRLAYGDNLRAFRHAGFWQSMDTPREKRLLEEMWQSGRAPWKTW